MTSLDPHQSPAAGIKIDSQHLLKQVPALVRVKRKQRTWNDFGGKLVLDLQNPAQAVRQSGAMAANGDVSEWAVARQLIHGVLATRDSQFDGIRKRLGNLETVSTPTLLSTLGLWLAGVLGISVTVTKPMVATILFAVAEAGGNWEILNETER